MANPISIRFNCQLPIRGLFPGLFSIYDTLYIIYRLSLYSCCENPSIFGLYLAAELTARLSLELAAVLAVVLTAVVVGAKVWFSVVA